MMFHHFLSSLGWIHNLYLKACGPPGPAPPGRGRPKAHYAGRPGPDPGGLSGRLGPARTNLTRNSSRRVGSAARARPTVTPAAALAVCDSGAGIVTPAPSRPPLITPATRTVTASASESP